MPPDVSFTLNTSRLGSEIAFGSSMAALDETGNPEEPDHVEDNTDNPPIEPTETDDSSPRNLSLEKELYESATESGLSINFGRMRREEGGPVIVNADPRFTEELKEIKIGNAKVGEVCEAYIKKNQHCLLENGYQSQAVFEEAVADETNEFIETVEAPQREADSLRRMMTRAPALAGNILILEENNLIDDEGHIAWKELSREMDLSNRDVRRLKRKLTQVNSELPKDKQFLSVVDGKSVVDMDKLRLFIQEELADLHQDFTRKELLQIAFLTGATPPGEDPTDEIADQVELDKLTDGVQSLGKWLHQEVKTYLEKVQNDIQRWEKRKIKFEKKLAKIRKETENYIEGMKREQRLNGLLSELEKHLRQIPAEYQVLISTALGQLENIKAGESLDNINSVLGEIEQVIQQIDHRVSDEKELLENYESATSSHQRNQTTWNRYVINNRRTDLLDHNPFQNVS